MKTLHIVPGDSAGASLLRAVRDAGLDDEVLRFRDDLSCGPIEPGAPAERAAWWGAVANDPPEPEAAFSEFWERVAASDARLVVWFGRKSAREMAFFLAWADRVGERPYHIVDVQLPMRRMEGSSDLYPGAHMAVVPDEDLRSLLGSERPITPDERDEAARLWQKLRAENAPFRVVTEEGLVSAPLDYFDSWLLSEAAVDWQTVRRIIHDAVGNNSDPYDQAGDMVLRARVVALAAEGKLVAEGDPWDWYCRVRLPDGSPSPGAKRITTLRKILQHFEIMPGTRQESARPRNKLSRLSAGDIFHATALGPISLTCLVVSVEGTTLRTRTVTHQLDIDFDSRTGIGEWRSDPSADATIDECRIDSIEPLPAEVHNALLGLDRRLRLSSDPAKGRLTEVEKEALVFIADFYPQHPLPKLGDG